MAEGARPLTATREPRSLLVRGGVVCDRNHERARDADLLIEDGVIKAIAPPGCITLADRPVHDAADRLIVPGFVNSHTHGHANLMKGVADRWTLEASLTNGPWLGGARDPETMYISALVGALDMISKGCTACFDLVYEFPRPTRAGFAAVARAYADAGIRATLAPMVADRTLFQAIPGLLEALPDDARREVSRFGLGSGKETLAAIEDIARHRAELPEGISLAIAPTIPHHCSQEFLLGCADIAARHRLPIHMHVAESRLQVTAAYELYGMSPVRYLKERDILGPGFVAAHAIWLDDADLDVLANARCAIAHIPASNLRLGSGIAHVRPMLERGITVGLATDGANSSDALSMLQAMRLASYGARAHAGSRDIWLNAAETLKLATAGGAELMGMAAGAGRIELGAPADLVFFDLNDVAFVPLTDPINQIITCADQSAVSDVMVGGRFIVEQRQFRTINATELRQRAAGAIERLSRELAGAKGLAARLEPHVVAFAEQKARVPLAIERLITPQRSS